MQSAKKTGDELAVNNFISITVRQYNWNFFLVVLKRRSTKCTFYFPLCLKMS